MFLFLTDLPSLEGTEWEQRIEAAMATGGEDSGPYKPRSGKIGASFKHYSEEQFQYIRQTASLPLRGFGYDPETQDFPNEIRLPKRQVKPGKAPDAKVEITTDTAMEVRKYQDTFGRGSTAFRKMLIDPVIASDGTELNVEEVVAARERIAQAKEKTQGKETNE